MLNDEYISTVRLRDRVIKVHHLSIGLRVWLVTLTILVVGLVIRIH